MVASRFAPAVILLLTGFLFDGPSAASPVYHLTSLTDPTGPHSQAFGINSNGDVVGEVEFNSIAHGTTAQAFIYSGGGVTKFVPLQEGLGSVAFDINDNGVVVGAMGVTIPSMAPTIHAFSYSAGSINDLGGALNPNLSEAYAVNNSGQIVGQFGVSNGPTYTTPFAINNGGVTVGVNYSNILGQNPPFSPTVAPGGPIPGSGIASGAGLNDPNLRAAYGINDLGQIVGVSATNRAFLYQAGGVTDLGVLPTGGQSEALAINNHGAIVGTASGRAFVYESGLMMDLNSLVDASAAGWTLQWATAINDSGQIAGFGLSPGDTAGTTHAFLLTPVPLPGSLWLLGAALGGLGSMRRRIA